MAGRLNRMGGKQQEVVDLLKEHLAAMDEILEHSRSGSSESPHAPKGPRKVKECVAVMLVEEVDGSETLMIVGDSDAPHLQLKGVLHHGIYAMAHEGEPGFQAP